MMYKLLFLEIKDSLSDREVIERAKTDMAYKYFLDLNPEDCVPSYSLLSVFRNTKIKDKSILEEMLTEEKIEKIQSSIDKDARQGYKSEVFGYKSHVAMTRERIVTALEVTSGEAPDGKFMTSLVEKSKRTGLEVKEVIGDKAYSGKDNLEYGKKNNIKIISRIHPIITNAIEN